MAHQLLMGANLILGRRDYTNAHGSTMANSVQRTIKRGNTSSLVIHVVQELNINHGKYHPKDISITLKKKKQV